MDRALVDTRQLGLLQQSLSKLSVRRSLQAEIQKDQQNIGCYIGPYDR